MFIFLYNDSLDNKNWMMPLIKRDKKIGYHWNVKRSLNTSEMHSHEQETRRVYGGGVWKILFLFLLFSQ